MSFKWVSSAEELAEAFRIRRDVFVEEHNVADEFEFDEFDDHSDHLLALTNDGEIAATARLLPSADFPGFARISRVAVLRQHRRKQLASRMVTLLEQRAKVTGYRGVQVSAIANVRPFYRKLGYQAFGPFFDQNGIRHQAMSKQLTRRVVVAVGGNAMVDGYSSVLRTAQRMVDLLDEGWEVLLTHGNGPQVGAALLRSEAGCDRGVAGHTLYECVAETQGTMGFQFCRALNEVMEARGRDAMALSIITQTEVDPNDPAFRSPNKPVGSFMTEEQAQAKKRDEGWHVMEDSGRGWRRVVPSPIPARIIQSPALRTLLQDGYLTVACGGGGIPVDSTGAGVDAVIDKDRTAALLGREVEADVLLIATAVPAVCLDFGKASERSLGRVSLDELRGYLEQGHFGAGSMLPKVEACIDFLSCTARTAIITNIENIESALRLEAGTCIDPYF
jgi:carbamate kinase